MLDLTAWDDGFDALSRHLSYDCFVWPGMVLLEEDASLMAVVEYRGRDQVEPFRRMQQERRGRALDHLVGMVVERDHGRTSRAAGRLGPQVLQQIGVATMEPIEHADHDEQPPVVPS